MRLQNGLSRFITDDRALLIIADYRESLGFMAVARKYKIGTSTLARMLKRHNVITRTASGTRLDRKLTRAQVAEIAAEYNEKGTSCEILASLYGISGSGMRYHLKRAGVKLKISPVPVHTPERAARSLAAIKAAWADPVERERRLKQVRDIGFKAGASHRMYKHGKKAGLERNSTRYQHFRRAVLIRDGRMCLNCGATTQLHIHHILAWIAWLALRYLVSNGITLCHSCHMRVEAIKKHCDGRGLLPLRVK